MTHRNTGQRYIEEQRLDFLRKKDIDFSNDDIERTLSYIQIPTKFSSEDVDRLIKIVAPIEGEVKLKDSVAYIYLRHKPALPLWQKGVIFVLAGFIYLWLLYHSNELFAKTARLFL
jgi:uncharacterized protein YdaL